MRLITLLTLCLAPFGWVHADADFDASPTTWMPHRDYDDFQAPGVLARQSDNRIGDGRLSFYSKLGPSGCTAYDHYPSVIAAFGLRRSFGHGAVDLSAQFTGPCTVAFPRIQYFYTLFPERSASLYWGGGVSYGLSIDDQGDFVGLMAEGTLGYNFYKSGRVRMFIEANITQPLIPTYQASTFAPAVAVAVGVGI